MLKFRSIIYITSTSKLEWQKFISQNWHVINGNSQKKNILRNEYLWYPTGHHRPILPSMLNIVIMHVGKLSIHYVFIQFFRTHNYAVHRTYRFFFFIRRPMIPGIAWNKMNDIINIKVKWENVWSMNFMSV